MNAGPSATLRECANVDNQAGRQAGHHLFSLDQNIATPGAFHSSDMAGTSPLELLRRHAASDWGDLCSEDRRENVYAIRCGFRLLSAYVLSNGVRDWIITEADRASTCLLLPSEY